LILKGQTNVELFAPRDTGKTTFTARLAQELAQDHGHDAPAFITVRVDLQRALSMPAFAAAVQHALRSHSDSRVRAAARRGFSAMEKEMGFDLKIVKGSAKMPALSLEQGEELLHRHLTTLAGVSDHLVVVFDEFQRLNRCPGEPLATIRSALMDRPGTQVSLVFTGSIREAMAMLLSNSQEPIFNQAAPIELPRIDRAEFFDYLDLRFRATGRQADEEALEHLLRITEAHPKRTQHLAWKAWQDAQHVDVDAVDQALDALLEDRRSEFVIVDETLAAGSEPEENERRALYLLADQGRSMLASRAPLILYGLQSPSRARDAAKRLVRRGLVSESPEGWQIVDPFLAEWLRRHSPFEEKD
jgi:hypothetical protein